jgi:Ca-activated chloride channel homolog
MTLSHAARLGILALAAVSAATLRADDTEPRRFRSGVEMVALTVTVQNRDGSFPQDLGIDDFSVFENGVRQTISFFDNATVPIDLALLVDSSASMYQVLPSVKQAVSTLVESLRPTDRASVMTIGGQTRHSTPFTGDRPKLLGAIRGMSAGGTTPLFDALYIALRTFERPDSAEIVKRRAIVVFTDGDDTASLTTYETVLQTAREAGIAVYAVILKPTIPILNERTMQNDFQMRRLSLETGARVMVAQDETGLEPHYRTIAVELAHQYSLAFVPKATLVRKQFTRVAVTVPNRNVTVRTRSGYIARP